MAVAPNNQKLIITKKNLPPSSGNYATDMRTIEQWANQGIVRKLIAGTDITLDPSSGIDDGNGITINSTGGGGGSGVSPYGTCTCGMDSAIAPFAQWLGPTDLSFQSTFTLGPWPSPIPGTVGQHYTFASSWITGTGSPGVSMLTLPEFFVPQFTTPHGTGIEILFYIGAWDFDSSYTNYAQYSGLITIADPGDTNVQATTADLTAVEPASGDLSLVNGSGFSGNGLVSGAAVTAYICSIAGSVDFPGGTTFP